MEKNIKFIDIINFIKTAIDKKYGLEINDKYITIAHRIKQIEGGKYYINTISMGYKEENEILIIAVDKCGIWESEKSFSYIIEVNDKKDILIWKMLLEEIKEYTFNKIETRFNNFFKEEEEKTPNIDDLNDDD